MTRAMKDSGVEWIGEIPEEWEVARVSSCFSEVKEKNTDNLYDNALQFKMGRIIPKPRKWDAEEIGETYSAYTIVHPGTIMVNGLNLEFDFVTQRVSIVEEDGIITSAYIAMRPNGSVDADYMCYLLKAYDYRRALHNMGKGLRKILNYSELKTKPILLPTLPEQKSIVKALNAECARIDAVIEQTRASIEEYRKLKQSVITQAVTKGIRPGRKMKDSGVEWLGEIPEAWSICKTKALADRIVVGVVVKPADYFDEAGSVPFLRGINVKEYKVNNSPMVYISDTTNELLSKSIVHTGDLLIVRDGSIGVTAVVPEAYDGSNVVSMIIVTCNEAVLPDFLCYSLNSDVGKTQFNLSKIGTALTHTSVQSVSNLFHVVPPVEEQEEIIAFLKSKVLSFDDLIQKKEKTVKELESYKKSLIFEYVTGKKEA